MIAKGKELAVLGNILKDAGIIASFRAEGFYLRVTARLPQTTEEDIAREMHELGLSCLVKQEGYSKFRIAYSDLYSYR